MRFSFLASILLLLAAVVRATEPAALPEKIDALVPVLMAKHHVPGVAVVGLAHRTIAFERYYGVRTAGKTAPIDAYTVFEAASMSKPPAAYVALKLVEQGKLDLDRPLHEYLDHPYLTDTPLHLKITARMVLSHTTGFPNWRAGGWLAGGPLPVNFEPGSKFGYSGEGFTYLQHVLEHITDEPFERYVQRTLLKPAGITRSSYVWNDDIAKFAAAGHTAKGNVPASRELFRRSNPAYSLYCTPRDYALFLVELLKPDRTTPHSLSARSLATMLTRTTQIDGAPPPARPSGPPPEPAYYGLGWAIERSASGDRIRHSGSNGTGFRCYCEWYPATGSGIVIMTNAVGGAALWRELLAAVGEP